MTEQRSPPYRNRALLDLAHNVQAAGELLAFNTTSEKCAALYEPRAHEICEQIADYYYLGVKYGGGRAYSDAQAGRRLPPLVREEMMEPGHLDRSPGHVNALRDAVGSLAASVTTLKEPLDATYKRLETLTTALERASKASDDHAQRMFYANLALVGVTVVLAGPSRLLLSRAMRVADFFAEQNSSEAGESGIVRFAAAGEVRGDRSSKAPL